MVAETDAAVVSTGVAGLDDVLRGGFVPGRLHLLEGSPGTGKTTLALQFLLEGARLGEPGLFISLGESAEELRAVGRSHGWDLGGISIFEAVEAEGMASPEGEYLMFHPAEVELGAITRALLAAIERAGPVRLVIDPLSELRLMARDPLRYRRQILVLKQFLSARGCTTLLLDEQAVEGCTDLSLQSVVHGVIALHNVAPAYGPERRRLRVLKLRGVDYRGGFHDFRLVRGGLEVYPRLVAAEHRGGHDRELVTSGLAALDRLLGGGLERGISSLIMGPSGSGKSSLSTLFAVAAAKRGERAAIFSFEESRATYVARSAGLAMDVRPFLAEGRITLRQIDPAEMSPGQFSHIVRGAVESGVRLVVLDSLNGYVSAMPEERQLVLHLHELLSYLGQQGVTTLMILEEQGLASTAMAESLNASYVADAVILLRYYEHKGELRKAVTVAKKRTGPHELTVNELLFAPSGIGVGEPLRAVRTILGGLPGLRGRDGD